MSIDIYVTNKELSPYFKRKLKYSDIYEDVKVDEEFDTAERFS
jgi:hypothetical protein